MYESDVSKVVASLVKERDDLGVRICKLSHFLNLEVEHYVGSIEFDMKREMESQLMYMRDYYKSLCYRILLLSGSEEALL